MFAITNSCINIATDTVLSAFALLLLMLLPQNALRRTQLLGMKHNYSRCNKQKSLFVVLLIASAGLLVTACGGGGGDGGGETAAPTTPPATDTIINESATSIRQNKLTISWDYDTSVVPDLKGFRVYDGTGAKVCETTQFDQTTLQHQMTCDIAPFAENATMNYTMTAFDNNTPENESAKSAPIIANKSPIAKIIAAGRNRNVQFNANESHDPDGTITGYAWEIKKDNITVATSINNYISYDFTTAGSYAASLTVTDDKGAQTSVQEQLNIL